MGSVNRAGTALPDCLPGFHFGIIFTTRRASSSQPNPMPLAIYTRSMEPSARTTNSTYTLPATPLWLAPVG